MRPISNISRRSALRGLGAGSLLMSGVLRSVRAEAAPTNTRVVFIFHANGPHHAWTPTGSGEAFTLTPQLAPLEPVRRDVAILRGLTLARGGGNPHRAATFSALGAGAPTSFDQVLARATQGTSPLSSLELAIGFTAGEGGVVPSLSQVDGVFVAAHRNPLLAYQRVAARLSPTTMTTDARAMEAALVARRSVLDHMRADAERFRMRLGADERPKLDLYFDSLREVEKGLGGFATGLPAAPSCGQSSAPPAALGFEAKVADLPQVGRLFLDLIAVSLACGVTRVATMMWGGGECWEDIPFLGVRNWHSTSHADPNPSGAPGAAMIKIQAYLAGEFAYFTQKLKSFGDGPGSVFDTTIALWGTQNGNPDQVKFSMEQHDRRNTPFVLTGRGNGAVKLGRVLDCNGLNHNDLYISIAQSFGLGVTTVGNAAWCKGPLPGLAG